MGFRRAALVGSLLAATVLVGISPATGVVGGSPASEGQFPFMASVQDRDGFAFCGASVVATEWVLTAAHCVQESATTPAAEPEDLQVVTGRTDLSDESTGQVLPVDRIAIHPDFDVALLHLAHPTVSPAIALAGPADDDLEVEGTRVGVAGWGDQLPTYGLFASNQLQHTELAVVADDDCGTTNLAFDGPSELCAEELLTDSCHGDSGGPLWGEKNGQRIQIGVVSYGNACAVPRSPGVYAEVNNASIHSWITSTAGLDTTASA